LVLIFIMIHSLEKPKADLLIRAKSIYTLEPGSSVKKSLTIRDGIISGVSDDPHGLDDLIGSHTQILDQPTATVLPTLDDTHTHLIFAGENAFDIPMHDAKNLTEILSRIEKRCKELPAGEWVVTSTDWLEYNIEEERLPTLQELDAINTEHPILVRRGGHNIVVNSYLMKAAGITSETQATGGKIGLDNDGNLNGLLQDGALTLINNIKPHPDVASRVEGIDRASADYAAAGTGCVRDCFVPLPDMEVLAAARDAGRLHVRVRALIAALGLSSVEEISQLLAGMERWRHLQRDPWLQVWGVKFILDGGFEAAATENPYLENSPHCCQRSDFRGSIFWDKKVLTDCMDAIISKGWRVGCHACGERAIDLLLDVYEDLLHRHPSLPTGTLVMEHGLLISPEQQKRAVALSIPVTIQHPLLHDGAKIMAADLGKHHVDNAFPARGWLEQGALVAGGSDYPVGLFQAMRSVWGMSSRETVIGVAGLQHAITPAESIHLHTTLAARLEQESDIRGYLLPGRFGDVTVWPMDPMTATDISQLRDLLPLYTIVGGKLQHGSL
jgi:predicted amidohydrolase YtcJ